MPKTKTKPTPVLSRSSSESSLLSIPSPTDESSYDVSKAEEKVKQKINKHAELVRKAAAVSKVAKPSTSKASGSRAKQWGATRGAKQNEAAASKARKDKENSSSDESLDSDSDSQSISFEDVEKLSQKELRDIYNKKIAKKMDVSMEVPRLKPTSDAVAKKKLKPRDVLEKYVMEPELMQRPQPTKRPAPAQPTKRPAPANVFAEPIANPSKKPKTPERQANADSLGPDDNISESQGLISSTPHPNRPFRNAELFPCSPVENLNTIELQKHLIVTGKKNTEFERRKVCTPEAVKRSLDYSDSNSSTSEQLSQNLMRTIDIQQSQDRQQRNLSATRSVINATTNSPASTHQLNGTHTINEQSEDEQEGNVSASRSVRNATTNFPVSNHQLNVTQSQNKQQRNSSATRSVINATTNSPASTHQLNGTHTINEQSEDEQEGNVSASRSVRNATTNFPVSNHQLNVTQSQNKQQRNSSATRSVINATTNSPASTHQLNGTHALNEQTENPRRKSARVSLVVGRKSPAGSKRHATLNGTQSINEQEGNVSASRSVRNATTNSPASTHQLNGTHTINEQTEDEQEGNVSASRSVRNATTNSPASTHQLNGTHSINKQSEDEQEGNVSASRSVRNATTNFPASTHQLNGTHTINEQTENPRRKSARVSLVVGRKSPAGSKRHATLNGTHSINEQEGNVSASRSVRNATTNSPTSTHQLNGTHSINEQSEDEQEGNVSASRSVKNATTNSPASTHQLNGTHTINEQTEDEQEGNVSASRSGINATTNCPASTHQLNGTHTINKQTENLRKKPARVSLVVERKSPAGSKRHAIRGDLEKVAIQSSQASTSSQSSVRTKRPSILNVSQSQNNQQRNLSATRSVINATTNSPASTHQLNGTHSINEQSEDEQEGNVSASRSVRNATPNSPASTHQLNGTHTINETENQRRKSARVSLVVGRRSPAGSKRHANRGDVEKVAIQSSQASTSSQSSIRTKRPSIFQTARNNQQPKKPRVSQKQNVATTNSPASTHQLNGTHSINEQSEDEQEGNVSASRSGINATTNSTASTHQLNGTRTTNKQTENQRKKPARVSLVVGRKRPAGSKRNANRGDVEKVAIQSSQASTSSQSSIRTKRPSIFQTARNNQQAKKPRVSQKQNVARYVGDDVFGNYHMIKSLDQFKTILQKAQPKHNLSTEQVKKLHLRVNHWLEDVFVDLCENTNQPYGFVTFQNLKECMMDQALVPDGISDDDLLMTMKQKMSKEDFKRSEGILYPSRHSKRNDTDDYFFRD